MRAAITGASGFVGRHLAAYLRACGDDVVAVSRQDSGPLGSVLLVPDYLDERALARAFEASEVVYHLAARAHQPARSGDEARFHEANVDTSAAVARACRLAGCRRLVLCSSIGVMGSRTETEPFRSGDEPHPAEPYARSKLAAEQVVASTLAAGACDYVVLRPPLVYGPDCPGNFRSLLRLSLRAPIVPLGSLTSPRTFIAVGNLVSAMRSAATAERASRRAFVIGDLEDMSVCQIVRIAASVRSRPGVVWSVPAPVLQFLATLSGWADAWTKLSSPLQVDSSDFIEATGWSAPHRAADALREAALQFEHS